MILHEVLLRLLDRRPPSPAASNGGRLLGICPSRRRLCREHWRFFRRPLPSATPSTPPGEALRLEQLGWLRLMVAAASSGTYRRRCGVSVIALVAQESDPRSFAHALPRSELLTRDAPCGRHQAPPSIILSSSSRHFRLALPDTIAEFSRSLSCRCCTRRANRGAKCAAGYNPSMPLLAYQPTVR